MQRTPRCIFFTFLVWLCNLTAWYAEEVLTHPQKPHFEFRSSLHFQGGEIFWKPKNSLEKKREKSNSDTRHPRRFAPRSEKSCILRVRVAYVSSFFEGDFPFFSNKHFFGEVKRIFFADVCRVAYVSSFFRDFPKKNIFLSTHFAGLNNVAQKGLQKGYENASKKLRYSVLCSEVSAA